MRLKRSRISLLVTAMMIGLCAPIPVGAYVPALQISSMRGIGGITFLYDLTLRREMMFSIISFIANNCLFQRKDKHKFQIFYFLCKLFSLLKDISQIIRIFASTE